MTTQKHDSRNGRILAVLLLVAAAGLGLAGCESDSTAPQDTGPVLTEADVAQQSAVVAAAMSRLGPKIVDFVPTKAKETGVYPYDFPPGGDVRGSVTLEFFSGGAGGTHVPYDQADYGMLYTDPGEVLEVEIPLSMDFAARFDVALAMSGVIDQSAGTAVIVGTGTFFSGFGSGDFIFSGLEVARSGGHPAAGSLTFTSGSIEVVVVFDGDDTAEILLDGTPTWTCDLETGELTLVE